MMKWINKKRNKKGFTLVELVVVIAILGILAAIAVPRLSESRKNAAIAAHKANVRTLESAATLAVSEGLSGENIKWDEGTGNGENDEYAWGKYIQTWPKFPTGLKGVTIGEDGDGNDITVGDDPKYEVLINDGVITVSPARPVED